jgi:hypothetical protein
MMGGRGDQVDAHEHDTPPVAADGSAGTSRRKVMALGAGVLGAAWVTPAILSVDAAAAATDPPPPVSGTLDGLVTVCGHELDPGDSFLVTATQNPGGFVGTATASGPGNYSIAGLPAGTYDVLLHPDGANVGRPDQLFPAAAVVPAGGTATFNPDYTANGC